MLKWSPQGLVRVYHFTIAVDEYHIPVAKVRPDLVLNGCLVNAGHMAWARGCCALAVHGPAFAAILER